MLSDGTDRQNDPPERSLPSTAIAMLITCEHGGNRIPDAYSYLFRHCSSSLQSHRGFDPGALVMAMAMAKNFHAPVLTSTLSRLLVDLNRSIGHRNLHMKAIHALPYAVRQGIIERYYQPYRTKAEQLVTQGIHQRGSVIHISCHSFTDNLDGVERNTDVGLLYDPARQGENLLCASWKSALKHISPDLQVRRNFPYRGRNDGLTSALRKKFPSNVYLGIELELNQKHLIRPAGQWAALRESIITSLEVALRNHQRSAGATR